MCSDLNGNPQDCQHWRNGEGGEEDLLWQLNLPSSCVVGLERLLAKSVHSEKCVSELVHIMKPWRSRVHEADASPSLN